ncbi:MAG: GAF domain-containing protein, partial [Synergistaceae bacterium]|nr:GAF domain-containing protein [Synergistaceae bacterium]
MLGMIYVERMKKLLHRYVFSDNLPLDARIVNLVYIIGFATAGTATVSRFFIIFNLPVNLMMAAIVASVGGLLYFSNRYSMHTVCGWVTVIVIGGILFPMAFFLLGGVTGGMGAYFVLGAVLVFLLAKGRALRILLPINLACSFLCYYVDFHFPDLAAKLSAEQQYMDAVQSFVLSGLFIGLVIKFQESLYIAEKEKGEKVAAALARRGELMRVVNGAASILLASDSDKFEGALLESLEMMARCIGVDHVHIWKNETREGVFYYSEQYAWADGEGLRSTRKWMEFPYADTLPSWETTLSLGHPINGVVSGFAPEERSRLIPYGIVSILVIPVFLHNQFWGFVSFDDTRNERSFPSDEVEILQSGSLLLVNAIARDAMMRKTRSAEERAKIMLDATPLCCNLWNKDFQVFDCNAEALKMLGVSDKEKYFENFFAYSPEFQPCGQSSFELGSSYVTAAFRDGRAVFEWMHQTGGGEPIPGEVTLVRVNLGDEEIVAGYTYDLRSYKKVLKDLDARLEQQQLMSAISQSFISKESMSVLINNALRNMGEFMGVSRVLIVVSDDKGDSHPIYVWLSSGEFATRPSTSGLSDALTTAFPRVLPSKGGIPSIACSDIHADGKYAVFEEVGLKAFIWSPQYVD